MAKIYVASSWRNQYFPDVVKKLREYGHEVYDFRNPPHNYGAFMWKDVDPNFDKWTVEEYRQGLQHPSSERQFQADLDALHWADTCLLVLPCGRSAHTEAGWMKGAGKRVVVYIPEMQLRMKKIFCDIKLFLSENWYWLLIIASTTFVIIKWPDCVCFTFFNKFNGYNLVFVLWVVLLLLPLFDKLEIMGVNLKFKIQNKESQRAMQDAINGQVTPLEELHFIKKDKEN